MLLASLEIDSNDAEKRMAAMKKYLDHLATASLESPIDVFRADPRTLPGRELPPGRLTDLYALYQHQCGEKKRANPAMCNDVPKQSNSRHMFELALSSEV